MNDLLTKERVQVEAPTQNPLSRVLAEAGIEVIPLWQVERFQRAFRWQAALRFMLGQDDLKVAGALVAVAVVFGVGFGLLTGPVDVLVAEAKTGGFLDNVQGVLGTIALTVLMVGGVLCAIAGLILSIGSVVESWRQVRWQRAEAWQDWAGNLSAAVTIPKPAQKAGLRAQRAAMAAGLYPTLVIEHLLVDPFLFIECGKERFCLAHWDEPFEAR